MNQKKTGAFIAALRKEKGYTQRTLAEALGLSDKTISKWETGNGLPEAGYMIPLCEMLGITVNELLTGSRIPLIDIIKKTDETMTELVRQIENEQLKSRIERLYGLEADGVTLPGSGVGAQTYIITCGKEKYVVKYPEENGMNHIEDEPKVCAFLREKDIPVCEFIPNRQGYMISVDENGRRFHVQKYIDGTAHGYHTASHGLIVNAAEMLGDIHSALKAYPKMSDGIGESFFKYRTVEKTLCGLRNTLKRAQARGDGEICRGIISNIEIMERFPKYDFDLRRLTLSNTHGDYMITQILSEKDEICGVIDWTGCCVHPAVWELMRFYVYACPNCADGEISIEDFTEYVKAYLGRAVLSQYDLENMGKLFFYFTAVSDFYGQYYDSMAANRKIFLEQALLSSKLLRWFDLNIDRLTALGKDLPTA